MPKRHAPIGFVMTRAFSNKRHRPQRARNGAPLIPVHLHAPLMGAALFLLTIAVYIPVIRTGTYIWDDDGHVYANKTLLTSQGLHDIWFKVSATQQYYPLVFSSFWIEHRLWDFWPTGYHITNVLLHAAIVVMLWRLLTRLRMRGAWVAAAIFAVHPVCVE